MEIFSRLWKEVEVGYVKKSKKHANMTEWNAANQSINQSINRDEYTLQALKRDKVHQSSNSSFVHTVN